MFDVVEVRWPSEPFIWRRARIWDVSNEGATPRQAKHPIGCNPPKNVEKSKLPEMVIDHSSIFLRVHG